MENYIQISKLNDFIFCPYSLYLHTIYDNFNKEQYQEVSQTRGTLAHESISLGKYGNTKRYWQDVSVYSEHLKLSGKIDIYDSKEKILIERKYKIKKIYFGYKLQLFAQYYCLFEKMIIANKICLHSLSDNKRYYLQLPNLNDYERLENISSSIQNYYFDNFEANNNKCKNCIYATLCDKAQIYD